jgi:acetyltransferase-like isoleucine patch superfamily enzyme
MTSRTPDDLLDAFIADGNSIAGSRPKKISGAFNLTWKGGGSVLELGSDVIFSNIKLVFRNHGGTIRLENGVTAKGRLEVSRGGKMRIGEESILNRVCDIRAGEGAAIDIGRKCLFSDVTIQTSDMHSILDIKTKKRTNPAAGIVIEDRVWVAGDVKIAKGVRIGAGAVIAAGSLVTRSVAPFCIAAGRPAKIVRTGIRWTQKLKIIEALPAPAFKSSDIPLEKEALQYLVKKKEYALVNAVIANAPNHDLPLYARWYAVFTRHKLGRPHPDDKAMLDQIILEAPSHKAAQELRKKLED